jgi:hypothetical protein
LDLFAHRIHNVEFLNGIVRLEFSLLRKREDGTIDPDAPVPREDVSFTVSMPVQGFMRSLGQMRGLAMELQKQGVLKQGPGGGEGGGGREARMRGQKELRDLSELDDGDDQLV